MTGHRSWAAVRTGQQRWAARVNFCAAGWATSAASVRRYVTGQCFSASSRTLTTTLSFSSLFRTLYYFDLGCTALDRKLDPLASTSYNLTPTTLAYNSNWYPQHLLIELDNEHFSYDTSLFEPLHPCLPDLS